MKLVIGAAYRFQHKLATENEAEVILLTRLLIINNHVNEMSDIMLMFEGFNRRSNLKYAIVMNMNTGREGAMQEVTKRVYGLYGCDAETTGPVTVIKSDHHRFGEIFKTFHESLEHGRNDRSKWMYPKLVWCHSENQKILPTMKWLI